MSTILNILLTITLINVSFVTSGRILVLFYHPGASHFYSFYPLFNELAERGHNVTVLSFSHVENPHKNYNELLFTGIPIRNATHTYNMMLSLDRSIPTIFREMHRLHTLGGMERELVLKSPHIETILETHREDPFDLVIVEQFITDFYMGLIHKLNVPFIGFSTCALPAYYYDSINLPDIPSYIPYSFSGYSWDMNLLQRTANWLIVKSSKLFYRLTQISDNESIRKRFGNDVPGVADIGRKMSLTFVNQHYSYTGAKPLSNQLVEVAGIHIEPVKPLPQKLKKILDNSTNGVLLVSWGGNLKSSSMPAHIQKEIIEGFARLKLEVIWKWEDAESMQKRVSKNVHVAEWLPQRDILCHPNVKGFWTHGGNLGTIESVHCGKPSIITPFYGDQYMNAAALSQRGMGFKENMLEITADNIYNLVQKILDPKVSAAAQKVSYEFNNRLNTPLETAVWYVEHTIATSGFELGRANASTCWFTYYSFDAITLIVLALASAIYILKLLLTQLFKCCCSRTENTQDATKKRN